MVYVCIIEGFYKIQSIAIDTMTYYNLQAEIDQRSACVAIKPVRRSKRNRPSPYCGEPTTPDDVTSLMSYS